MSRLFFLCLWTWSMFFFWCSYWNSPCLSVHTSFSSLLTAFTQAHFSSSLLKVLASYLLAYCTKLSTDRQMTSYSASTMLISVRGQLSLAIPSWVDTRVPATAGAWTGTPRHALAPYLSVWQCKLVSCWGLMKRRSAPLYGPYGLGRTLSFYLHYAVMHGKNQSVFLWS